MTNIFIGTPAYNGMVHVDYLNTILDFRSKLPVTVMNIGNESLIPRGRNTVLSYFNNMKDFTHLLYLDADIGMTANDLIKLIEHDKDVIGAPVNLKGFNKLGQPVNNVGQMVGTENGLIKADRVGTAVFMLSRKAVDALIENSEEYSRNPHTRGENKDIPHYDVFQTGVFDGEYYSEDYYVCKTLRDLGFDVYVDTKIKVRHNGMYVF